MNKKLFFGMLAASGMLFATSCNDELETVQPVNDDQVTISLGLEGGIATRAISDGESADKLVCAIYDANLNLLKNVNINGELVDANGQYVTESAFKNGLTDKINVSLTKGQTYTMVFWAQNPNCDAYNTNDLTAVQVDYTNGADGDVNNDETRDAFYATKTFTVEGNKEINVTLKRPFAQINMGVTKEDWEAAVASGITIEKSSVVIKEAATSINLLTGKVGDETTDVVVTYKENAIPQGERLKVDTDNDGLSEEFYWLSMSYILVADHDDTEDANGLLGTDKALLQGLKYTFIPTNGAPIVFEEGLNGAPVRRNWRTNILGKILTGDIQFNITIDKEYDGDFVYSDGTLEQELEFLTTFGGTYNLENDITVSNLNVRADFILNFENNATLTAGTTTDYAISVTNGTATINGEGGTINSNCGGIEVTNGANLIYNGGKLDINSANAGGSYLFSLVDAGSTATITGGEFGLENTPDQECAYIYAGTGTTVYVTGGTFGKPSTNSEYAAGIVGDGNVIISGGIFDFDPSAWVASGYHAVKCGGKWYVVEEHITPISNTAEFEAALEYSGTIVLMSDFTLDESLLFDNPDVDIRLDMNGKTITTVNDPSINPVFFLKRNVNGYFVIEGNGTVNITNPSTTLLVPHGNVVIENGTFIRSVPDGTPANKVAGMIDAYTGDFETVVTINGGYFDGGYYDDNADPGKFSETAADVANRNSSKDANLTRVAYKNNIDKLLNKSSNNLYVYGGTFVGANPAWGDEGCMLPTTPDYLRPWSFYQGAFLDGQVFHNDKIELPEAYTISESTTQDGRPVYTVTYKK